MILLFAQDFRRCLSVWQVLIFVMLEARQPMQAQGLQVVVSMCSQVGCFTRAWQSQGFSGMFLQVGSFAVRWESDGVMPQDSEIGCVTLRRHDASTQIHDAERILFPNANDVASGTCAVMCERMMIGCGRCES